MSKNVLIIGAGRFGRYAAIQLHDLGHQVMVIDRDEERINRILPCASDARIGDSTDEAFIRSLGVQNYDVCIVSIGDDFLSSLQTTFTLRESGARKIISRATSSRQEKFLLRNGADAVVFPERELGFWTAIRYSSDNISNYVDLSDGYSIFEISVPEKWQGRRIGELDVRKRFHINILGVRDGTAGLSGTGAPRRSPVPHGPRIPAGRLERLYASAPDYPEPPPSQPPMNMDVRYDTMLHSGQTMLVLGKTENIQKIL